MIAVIGYTRVCKEMVLLKIADVIKRVDEWLPNVFSASDKLDWCYECTMHILNECPVYDTYSKVKARDGGVVMLPKGVGVCDIAELYVNGKNLPVTNETDFGGYVLKKGDEVVVVYRKYPDEYELTEGEVGEDVETVVGAPYESMYVDYVCAQIAFLQNDAAEYNKFIGAFNDKFSAYKVYYKSNSPSDVPRKFKNWF